MAGIGSLREQLVIQTTTPRAFTVSSLTRSSTTATATTSVPHGYQTGEYVTIAGATPSGYNGKVQVTVTSTTAFTYTVSVALSTPATGNITATYASDAQGGRREVWRNLKTGNGAVWAEMMPLRSGERIQAQAMTSQTLYRFKVRTRSDVTPKMRALWTTSWTRGMPQKTLQIHGIVPFENGRTYMLLDCGETA